ncbi:MAG: PIN domain-containing protein [Deltaproteobacteria bacterium]|nr:PIN domain-containing protein [Deltaproteobacteria bacterium]
MIFIDTGAFLARYLRKDQHHRSAVAVWEKLGSKRENCVTSNFILDETFTLLRRRAGYRFAVQRAKNIYASQAFTICRPDKEDEIKALQFFSKYADQHVSFTDCISFVLMKREKINRVFSFDRHFELAGFHLIP